MTDCTHWTQVEREFIERCNRFAILFQTINEAAERHDEETFQRNMREFMTLGRAGFDFRHLPQPLLPEVWAAAILASDTIAEYQRKVEQMQLREVLKSLQDAIGDRLQPEQPAPHTLN